ncbi:hypothetical protein EUV02_15480 [Polymorphobacter arshaanensis]|uniref:Uncharacterized protein n=1 Tax=Glacieibacterium arshaanense TaxID=2511025 RepID=A0A4Y9EJA7_9SPHN|nr:hypothetical protein [Polymorphobacter arshaanensis]TFU00047.1 hypothetical protein EUV02_15480 [Polymorphobacter arshaanensis]
MILMLKSDKGQPLTKKFIRNAEGSETKKDFANVYEYYATPCPVFDIHSLSFVLTELEAQTSSCIVRGELVIPTEGKIRRTKFDGSRDGFICDRLTGTQWLMCDFDKVEAPEWLPADIRLRYLIEMLPACFHKASYHYQWSSSAGRDGWKTLSCHIWFWLTEPWPSDVIRKRVKVENWEGVDRAPFDAIQIHYTASPVFVNQTDTLDCPRSGLVLMEIDAVELPPFVEPVPVPRAFKPNMGQATGFEGKLQEMLDDIGPNYHEPIRSVIMFYVMACAVETYDIDAFKDRLMSAIHLAPTGKSDKNIYDESYVNRSIDGAVRKNPRNY